MARLWLSLAVMGSMVCAGSQQPSPSATSPAESALIASISSAVAAASMKPYVTPLTTDRITEWIALGDSVTAGVGSNGLEDYIRGSNSCHRYKHSYPVQMQANTRWPGDARDRKLTFGACSGAKLDDVERKQLTDSPSYDHVKFGNPQLAIITISGNDLGFAKVINACVLRAYGKDLCDDVLSKAENQIEDPAFQGAIDKLLLSIAVKGRINRGANPLEAFQVFVNGYVPLWNEVDKGCDTISWCFWGRQRDTALSLLTTRVRKRMNDITRSLNAQLERSAYRLQNEGVIYVDGFQDPYNGHQFCDPTADADLKTPISPNTWFWHSRSPWNGGEGPTISSNTPPSNLDDDILAALVPDANRRASITTAESPSDVSDAFGSREALEAALDELRNDTDANVAGLSERWRRIFHAKGSGLSNNANVNLDAVLAARVLAPASAASGPSPAPPAPSPTSAPASEPSDICGTWYKVVFDYFEVRGKDFDPAKFGTDGSDLKKQIQGCGALTNWHFENTPNDPRFAWFAHGNLPMGTKGCVGRAVVSAGGESADGCKGSG